MAHVAGSGTADTDTLSSDAPNEVASSDWKDRVVVVLVAANWKL